MVTFITQVRLLQEKLGVDVGTVDKFQGKAEIVIVSMTSSDIFKLQGA